MFSRHTRHLWIAFFLIASGAAGGAFVRSQLVPSDFGELGPYRTVAIAKNAALPMVHQSDQTCIKCHTDVHEARAESPHQAVACRHCHGHGAQHVAEATRAAENPGSPITPAQEWDGSFGTSVDLFVTKDRATCLACHTSVVGMPESFRSINVAAHLEEQGAENVNAKDVCFECHDGHSPGL
ncbi:MAG: hypothetical protein R3C49_20195 [Planctomycetaceae bacterium]